MKLFKDYAGEREIKVAPSRGRGLKRIADIVAALNAASRPFTGAWI